MTQITKDSLTESAVVTSILEKGLHGGFLDQETLTEEEIEYCDKIEWIQQVNKFKCRSCGQWHTTPPGEERCLRTQEEIDPSEIKPGYRVIADSQLDIDLDTDYTFFVAEAASSINTNKLPYKSIVFIPNQEKMEFSDRAGSVVFLPIAMLPSIIKEESRREIIRDINNKRKRLVDWKRLDDNGDDFEEILFRLVKRDPDYFNESWGGSGPDQGKDGFCSINLGGRETRVLVQAKFNNDGTSVNGNQVEKSCRKAQRHDCGGVIIGAVKTSGDLESELEQGTFHSKTVNYLRVWPGPELKEKLSPHPDIIAEYFLE